MPKRPRVLMRRSGEAWTGNLPRCARPAVRVLGRDQKLEPSRRTAHHQDVLVRAASVDDVPFIGELAGDVFAPFGDYRALLPKWFRTPGVMTFVSEVDRERTGYVMIAFFRDGGWLVGDVLAIAVSPAHQRRGIGRMLMQHAVTVCEQVAEHSPVRALRLSVADGNERALRLFCSFGFKKVEGDFGQYEGGQQAFHMERPLGP